MNRKTVPVVILLFCCVLGYPQNGVQIYYRKTTVDPIADFFSRSCDLRSATCVERGECGIENFSKAECTNKAQVCCLKQGDENSGTIVFPEASSRNPAIMTTRRQTTTIPTRTTTTSTTTTTTTSTTTTTTTEEPIDEWLTPDCGTQQSIGTGVTGIRDSNRGEFPWNVEIYSKNKNDFGIVQNVFLCGGTLIDSFIVLTSGNCVTSNNISNLYVDAGVWNVEDVDEKRQMRKVEKVIRHHQFQQTKRVSSLALLVLDDQVDFSRTVNRICLPEADTDFSESTCFLTGWGGTGENPSETIRPKMKVVDMDQLNHKDCQHQIRRTMHSFALHESFQCAREESENHICPFDVGSPLICTIPGQDHQFYQAGIFVWNQHVSSNGNADCTNNSGVVNLFTNIQKFRRWIDTEMEKLERNIHIYRPQLNDESDETEV
ncbi:inactive CLIP domain-containing serine protease A30-like [Ochlerotatus camptorhynchus]|uniref:inactive CLIP domain-containing serine protease A30-like n=1 Tax=Ochlerotatus camptorhynchus TaxID=644619 RepID=UPI0031CFD514